MYPSIKVDLLGLLPGPNELSTDVTSQSLFRDDLSSPRDPSEFDNSKVPAAKGKTMSHATKIDWTVS